MQLMQLYVQKSIRTTLPRRPFIVSGLSPGALNQSWVSVNSGATPMSLRGTVSSSSAVSFDWAGASFELPVPVGRSSRIGTPFSFSPTLAAPPPAPLVFVFLPLKADPVAAFAADPGQRFLGGAALFDPFRRVAQEA